MPFCLTPVLLIPQMELFDMMQTVTAGMSNSGAPKPKPPSTAARSLVKSCGPVAERIHITEPCMNSWDLEGGNVKCLHLTGLIYRTRARNPESVTPRMQKVQGLKRIASWHLTLQRRRAMTRRERLGLIKVSILPRESLVLVCKMQAIGADLEWTTLSCYGHRQGLQILQER